MGCWWCRALSFFRSVGLLAFIWRSSFHSPALARRLDLSNNISTARTASSSPTSTRSLCLSSKQSAVVHHRRYRKNIQPVEEKEEEEEGGLHTTSSLLHLYDAPLFNVFVFSFILCTSHGTNGAYRKREGGVGREGGLKKGRQRHTLHDIFAHMACTCLAVDRFVHNPKDHISAVCVCQCPRERDRTKHTKPPPDLFFFFFKWKRTSWIGGHFVLLLFDSIVLWRYFYVTPCCVLCISFIIITIIILSFHPRPR